MTTKIGMNRAPQYIARTSELLRMDALNMRSVVFYSSAPSKPLAALLGFVCSMLVLTACQPKGDLGGQSSAPVVAENATGTGDSGGGNGLNGKFFESYAINPSETVEWKKSIAPVIDNLSKLARSSNVDYSPLFSSFAKSKTWYIAPVKLVSLSKKDVGVEFIQDPMQQHVLQTPSEIWIEKSFWDGADQNERGLGMLHEVVMGVYLTQFMTVQEMCVALSFATKAKCAEESVSPRKKPKPMRPLNEIDYANIRSMTTWLSEHGATTADAVAVHREFMRNGFDSRFEESPSVEDRENAPLEFKAPEYFRRLTDASIGRRVPKFCSIARGHRGATTSCEMTLTLNEQDNAHDVFEIKIEMAGVPGFSKKRTLRALVPLTGYWGKDGVVQSYARDIEALNSNEPGYMQNVGLGLLDGQKIEVGTDVFPIYLYISKDGISVRAISAFAQRITRVGAEANGRVDVDYISPASDEREYIQLVDSPLGEGIFLNPGVEASRGSFNIPVRP